MTSQQKQWKPEENEITYLKFQKKITVNLEFYTKRKKMPQNINFKDIFTKTILKKKNNVLYSLISKLTTKLQ